IYQTNTLELARSNYDQLEPNVDLMILIGSISTKGALSAEINTPTIGLGVSDPYLQQLPLTDGKSGTKNFTYIWSSVDFVKELEQFRRISDFKNLAILVDPGVAITFDVAAATKALDSLSQTFSTAMNVIPVGNNVTQTLTELPPNTDAVYLSELYTKKQADIQSIARILKEKKLPSFSSTKWHVDAGILGSISDDNGLDQVIRKLSVMADDALAGEPLEKMLVVVNNKEDFYLNLQTAKEIDLSPPFEVIFTANLIGQNPGNLPIYSLEEIMQKALEANFDIKISYKDIELTEQDIISGRSALLPALDMSLTGSQINEERANPLLQSSERTLTGQLALTQLIYSEEAIAGLKILHHVNKAQEFDTESDVLAILLDTYISYFNLLAAKTNLLIQQENLKNTKTNLELAKIRLQLGSASKADLFRWESEVATAKQSVVVAQTDVIASKLQLNVFLANSLEDEFDIEDITMDDELFQELQNGPLEEFVKTPDDFGLASDFLVLEATTNNPNKKFLLENIKATEREKLQNKRLFYVPQIALQAQTDQILDRGGVGSVETDDIEFFDNSWQVGLSLNYSLFQGLNRKANLQRSNVQLEQLYYSRQQLDQNLELAVRTRALSLLNTSTNIVFSQTAADNAKSNYELVRDNYQQGVVNITQLIDAQQASLNASLAYAISIYNYLQAYVQLEFAVGSFSKFTSQEEQDALRDRFIQFISDN
ncbi:MAG: ABC transporter substrate binding protein, partial [Bacteroidota bacterium]